MKIALFCYHANAKALYNDEWIQQYKNSILNQTYSDFAILEHNYDGGDFRIFKNSYFESVKMPSFVYALNYLLDKALNGGFDYCLNSNADDFYTLNRIEKQLPYLKSGFDIVSSNFSLVQDDKVTKQNRFHEMNIAQQLSNNHNIVAHPCVGYSRKFIENNRYVPDEQPAEDMMLWKRTCGQYRFIILEENLLFHRIHNNAVCRSDNR